MSKLIYFKKLSPLEYSIVSKIYNQKSSSSYKGSGRFMVILNYDELYDDDFIFTGNDSWNRKVRYMRAYISKHPEELI